MPVANAKNLREWFKDRGLEPGPAREWAAQLKAAGGRKSADAALDDADRRLEGHGVEAIRGDYHVDNYYYDIVALYVNMGDTYNGTILYETDTGRFLVTTMGDWVEQNERRYNIQ